MSSDAVKDECPTNTPMASCSASSMAAIMSTIDPAQRDWHVEILSGLFLRCTEQELDWLEEEANRHGLEKQVLLHDGSESCSQHESAVEESTQLDNEFASCRYLEEGSTDFSLLSLIPSALRGICSAKENTSCVDTDNHTDSPRKKSEESNFNRPLLIPSSWRRPNYESLTLPELERKIADSIVKNGIVDGTETGCLYSETNYVSRNKDSEKPKDEPETYRMMTILYNECSMSALANWAVMDLPASGDKDEVEDPNSRRLDPADTSSVSEVTPVQSPPHDSAHDAEWDRPMNETSGKGTNNVSFYNMPIPPCTFRICGVCGKFGHYEVECELLLEPRSNESKTFKRTQDVQSLSGENNKRLKMDHEVNGLNEDVRKSIISELAKEIRVQRLLQGLVEDTQHVKSANGFLSSADQAHHHKSMQDSGNDDEISDDEVYVSKATCCNVCKSEMGGNRMLMCDGCDDLYHLLCLDPPLDSVPEGEWLCDSCISYDSDVSSVVEIEGCGDFVIEQRKRSLAQRETQYSGVSLGQHNCQWSAAMSFLTETDPVIDREYLQKHVDDANHRPNFNFGKLCWAKRFDDELDRLDWWPAMIVEPNIEAQHRLVKELYTVRFFYLEETKDVSRSDVLAYLSYYEDIGYKRLATRDSSAHNAFQVALEQSVMALGLKSFGQALKVSRSVTQKMLDSNCTSSSTHKKLKSSGWRPPVGWEHADVEEIDDFIILSKEKHVIRPPQRNAPANEDEINALAKQNLQPNDIKQSFHTDEVVGGIVSWCSNEKDSTSYDDESLHAHYGIVVSINLASQMALVRSISHCILDCLLYESTQSDSVVDVSVYEHDVGSTVWMDLHQLRFVSAKPKSTELVSFKRTLRSRMTSEMKLHSSRCRAAATTREYNSVELRLNDDMYVNHHFPESPAPRDPL